MALIDDQQRTIGVPQDRAPGRSDELAHVLVVVGAEDQQPHRVAVASQVLQEAAGDRDRLQPQIQMASLPSGQPAVQVGERAASAVGIRRLASWPGPAGR